MIAATTGTPTAMTMIWALDMIALKDDDMKLSMSVLFQRRDVKSEGGSDVTADISRFFCTVRGILISLGTGTRPITTAGGFQPHHQAVYNLLYR